jgi:hypothetical protein
MGDVRLSAGQGLLHPLKLRGVLGQCRGGHPDLPLYDTQPPAHRGQIGHGYVKVTPSDVQAVVSLIEFGIGLDFVPNDEAQRSGQHRQSHNGDAPFSMMPRTTALS